MTEFDSHSLNNVMLGTSGWSGSVDRKLSSFALNDCTLQLVKPRMFFGKQLKRRGPLWGSEANLIDLILCDADGEIFGSTQERPLLSLWVTFIGVESKLGTWPSMTLQV